MPRPKDEAKRLEALDSYNILDTEPEEAFDRITRLASAVTDTPTSVLSFVDDDRQWSKSCVGLPVQGIPRAEAFCAHAIQQATPFLVPDMLADPRFASNPFVTGEPFIRFYLGIPLLVSSGYLLGTLCVLDTAPHMPSDKQVSLLTDLADMAVDALELRQLATADCITGALTRRALDMGVATEIERCRRYGRTMCLIRLKLDGLSGIRGEFGHRCADLMLQSVIGACRTLLRTNDLIGARGADTFDIVLPQTSFMEAELLAAGLRTAVESQFIVYEATKLRLTGSLGFSELGKDERSVKAATQRIETAVSQARSAGLYRMVGIPAPQIAASHPTNERRSA